MSPSESCLTSKSYNELRLGTTLFQSTSPNKPMWYGNHGNTLSNEPLKDELYHTKGYIYKWKIQGGVRRVTPHVVRECHGSDLNGRDVGLGVEFKKQREWVTLE